MTRTLGAVLAGGRSRRFGSDKAVATLGGVTLIDRTIAALSPQVDAILICGRVIAGMSCAPDRPAPDLGPLGGLAAALHHAAATGFDVVVSVPCDTPLLPADLVATLRSAGMATFAATLPVVGWWPARLAAEVDRHLAEGGDRSMWRWAARVAAVPIPIDGLVNVNTRDDLRALGK